MPADWVMILLGKPCSMTTSSEMIRHLIIYKPILLKTHCGGRKIDFIDTDQALYKRENPIEKTDSPSPPIKSSSGN